ncbi:ArgS-related anticodon-binding protein NrtL [Streptomyces sp. KL118A]|uniref:ArgS-related anticodon-binding protein NrtL n=1 Tax=Streptomyces sp. KL118A TaxID=3045153 RepID=UPI00278BEC3F|nr:DALR anticodon-binding domain-containing protein [Streptomyces sp. KL118A]
MTPVELSRTVLRAMRHAVDAGELSVAVPVEAGSVRVERPRPGGCGDFATNVALQIAGAAGRSPRHVAEVLSPRLAAEPGIAGVDITGPGFLNITLAGARADAVVREIRERGRCYGHVHPDTGALAQIHVPREIRAAVLADSARRILRSQGVLVRVTCDAAYPAASPAAATPDAADPAWADALDALDVRIDAYGRPPEPLPTLRPVPAGPVHGGPDPHRPATLRLGRDATRWALLHPAPHDHPRITPEQGGDAHLVQRESNPLFRVRYAYARSRALTRNAAELGFDARPGDTTDPAGSARPLGPAASALLDALADHPATLASAARHRAPDRLARQLVVIADAFLAFQSAPRGAVLPLGDEKPSAAHRARLALAEAAGTVLAGGLSLLGISAPEYL